MDPALASQVNSIRLTLQAVEAQVGTGRLQRSALEDLKSAVDEIRLRIWAIMAAAAEGSDGLALQRFRLRRAIEFCDNLSKEFEDGTMSTNHKECDILLAVLGRLNACIAGPRPDRH
jgi:hypothetical protein